MMKIYFMLIIGALLGGPASAGTIENQIMDRVLEAYQKTKTPKEFIENAFYYEDEGLKKELIAKTSGVKKMPPLRRTKEGLEFNLDGRVYTVALVDALNDDFDILRTRVHIDSQTPIRQVMEMLSERLKAYKNPKAFIEIFPEANAQFGILEGAVVVFVIGAVAIWRYGLYSKIVCYSKRNLAAGTSALSLDSQEEKKGSKVEGMRECMKEETAALQKNAKVVDLDQHPELKVKLVKSVEKKKEKQSLMDRIQADLNELMGSAFDNKAGPQQAPAGTR